MTRNECRGPSSSSTISKVPRLLGERGRPVSAGFGSTGERGLIFCNGLSIGMPDTNSACAPSYRNHPHGERENYSDSPESSGGSEDVSLKAGAPRRLEI